MGAEKAHSRRLRVIVGYDASRSAVHAVETAARLIREADATVVHLWEPPFASAELRQRLAAQAHRRSGSARSIAATLSEYAAERAAAVLVVGSRGRSGSRELLLGSVAKAVLHHAHTPVLVVPAARTVRP